MPIIHGALTNTGNAAHSERAIRYFSLALHCQTFDVRCLDETTGQCTFNERGMSLDAITRLVLKLRQRNANGSGVFIRPCRPFALADDVLPGTLERMLDDQLRIAAVIETSPGSFQVWVPLSGSLQLLDPAISVAACERLADLYDTDPGVAHRDSFGRAPGFRNRKPIYDHGGKTPLVKMSNRHCVFRGYDRSLLEDAKRIVGDQPKHPGQRSGGPVLTACDHGIPEDHGPIEIWQGENHIVTFSEMAPDRLFEQWLSNMLRAGYCLPPRQDGSGIDRSQRDLDVLRSMHTDGVPRHVAQAALEAGSDKARERGPSYVRHLLAAVWGEKL